MYPNPTTATVIIESPIKVDMVKTDLNGKLVLSLKEAKAVDLKELADGSCFFCIMDEHGALPGTEIQKLTG